MNALQDLQKRMNLNRELGLTFETKEENVTRPSIDEGQTRYSNMSF